MLPSAHVAASAPVWVAVDVAFDERGVLKPSLFPDKTQSLRYQESIANASSETKLRFLEHDACEPVVTGTMGGANERDVTDLLEHAAGVYRGRVVEKQSGFYGEQPGTLLRAEVIRAPRRSPHINIDRELLVFYNYARFSAGGHTYCIGVREPRVGDEFIVFVYGVAGDTDRTIVTANNRIFFAGPNGSIEAEPSWQQRLLHAPGMTTLDAMERGVAERERVRAKK